MSAKMEQFRDNVRHRLDTLEGRFKTAKLKASSPSFWVSPFASNGQRLDCGCSACSSASTSSPTA